jgi:hypothetical protein
MESLPVELRTELVVLAPVLRQTCREYLQLHTGEIDRVIEYHSQRIDHTGEHSVVCTTDSYLPNFGSIDTAVPVIIHIDGCELVARKTDYVNKILYRIRGELDGIVDYVDLVEDLYSLEYSSLVEFSITHANSEYIYGITTDHVELLQPPTRFVRGELILDQTAVAVGKLISPVRLYEWLAGPTYDSSPLGFAAVFAAAT